MDCSMTRPSATSRFPFFPFSLWSKKPQQSVSTQTQTQTPQTAKMRPQLQIQTTTPTQTQLPPSPPETPVMVEHPQQTAEERAERDHQDRETARQEALDELDSLVGHENVKRQLRGVQTWVQICRRHGRDPKNEWYNMACVGNPGTGKTTVARIYAKMLYALDICDSPAVYETTGTDLANQGLDGVKQIVDRLVDAHSSAHTAGVLIVDQPHTLGESGSSQVMEQILPSLLQAVERKTGRNVVIFSGEETPLLTFLRDHPRLQQRICSTLRFYDFDRNDLAQLIARRIVLEYQGRMQVEGGLEGPYVQAAARRLARGRAMSGFTNAHAVRELVKTVAQRQAHCLADQQDSAMDEVDYFFFSKDDLLGPRPEQTRNHSEAWAAMQKLVGQDSLRMSVADVFDTAEENYHREIRNQRRLPLRVNRIFAGPPGTGKSTAVRLYAQILLELGLLTNGEVRVKPWSAISQLDADSIRDIVDSNSGNVLVIDVDSDRQETSQNHPVMDPSALETLWAPQDNHCTVVVGTHDAVSHVLHQTGSHSRLSRAMDTQLVQFAPLTRDHLEELFHSKLREQELDVTPDAFQAALDMLDTARMRQDFDHARAVEHLLTAAQYHFERRTRVGAKGEPMPRILEGRDFNPERVGGTPALDFREELRQSIVSDDIIAVLKRYHHEMKISWMQGLNPSKRMPCGFVFKGAAGTGKKTVARELGTLFYKMGMLSHGELVPCSIADLLAPHMYPTAIRARGAQLDRSRGRVLFIEDAHRLGEVEGPTKHAVDELVYQLPRYLDQTVVILAGPAQEMDQMLANRPRLAALFQEEIIFRNPTPRECLRLLDRRLTEQKIAGPRLYLTDPRTPSHREFTRAIQILSMFPCWSNARDVETLARWMVAACVKDLSLEGVGDKELDKLQLNEEQAMGAMVKLFSLKRDRLRFNQDPKARALPRVLSQPRITDRTGVKFPV
ncbi:protein GbpA [Aspergillus saccharolyticus JOP 1030-1]|uniref:ATPase, AAA family protein n=1 Tax=Aspergillus saccharolyticus JOP 1030-1 TaxID=1450539 RepID=A0A318ZHH9_9EURO|nr:ATPase, AAA family protein [Aspergillus saccharolyticus JOP 1030-1]PYH47026.1 ATPase, AAA family protein [Aspergillus saccharolyticus JOP 1030-1]